MFHLQEADEGDSELEVAEEEVEEIENDTLVDDSLALPVPAYVERGPEPSGMVDKKVEKSSLAPEPGGSSWWMSSATPMGRISFDWREWADLGPEPVPAGSKGIPQGHQSCCRRD